MINAPIISISGFALTAFLGVSAAELNEKYWHINHFYIPAVCACLISLYVLYTVKASPKDEGLVDISELNQMRGIKNEELKNSQSSNLSSLQIFYRYVFKNKNAWYVALVDTFVYMVRFGLISWLPIYYTILKKSLKFLLKFCNK